MPSRRTSLLALAGLTAASVITVVTVGAPAVAAAATAAGSYVPVRPVRVVDTRNGVGGHHGAIRSRSAMATRVTRRAGVPSSVSAVAITLTVVSSTRAGSLTAWAGGTSRPATASLSFVRGTSVAGLAVVQVPASGVIDIYNGSSGTVQVVADISGYYTAGTSSAVGTYRPVAPSRAVDTRTGRDANRKGWLPAGGGFSALIAGHAGVPTSGVAAVVVTITVVTPKRTGRLLAYPQGGAKPSEAAVQFVAGQQSSALAVVPLHNGRISLVNVSSGSVQVAVDVSGYLRSGVAAATGSAMALPTRRVLDTRTGLDGNRRGVIPARHGFSAQIGGKAGVPITGASVVMTITDVAPTRSGGVTVWRQATAQPSVTNLHFNRAQSSSDVVIVPLSSTGKIDFYNASTGSMHIIAAVDGYILDRTNTAPRTSVSRYVRNLSASDLTSSGPNYKTMHTEGAADAAAGSKLVLLDIGAQLNNKSGVQLSATTINLTYAQLVTAVKAYLAGFGSVSGATVAIGTNNDGNFSVYSATARGADWANKVVDKVSHPAGVSVLGANDIEGGFASTQAQAAQWEASFVANTSADLIFNGSADGCSSTFGATGGTCEFGWTQAQYYALAGGRNPTRIQAVPQIYQSYQATQWTNIEVTGGRHIAFLGSLTEHAAVSSTLTAAQGWESLYLALSTVAATPRVRAATDLRVDG